MKGMIFEEECSDIIKYMYNEADSKYLLKKLKKLYHQKDYDPAQLKSYSREERLKLIHEQQSSRISYTKFEKVILDF